jgi:Peptidase propeptide and YPEB domain
MAKISSFKTAAGTLGIAALAKTSAFAIARLGIGRSARAGRLGKSRIAVPQNHWISLEDLHRKVEALGYKMQKAKLSFACDKPCALYKSCNRDELFVDPASGKTVGQF